MSVRCTVRGIPAVAFCWASNAGNIKEKPPPEPKSTLAISGFPTFWPENRVAPTAVTHGLVNGIQAWKVAGTSQYLYRSESICVLGDYSPSGGPGRPHARGIFGRQYPGEHALSGRFARHLGVDHAGLVTFSLRLGPAETYSGSIVSTV
jgi:hypothetical protein